MRTHVGRFEIVQRLSYGTVAVVYLVDDGGPAPKVLKMLNPLYRFDEDLRSDFLLEADRLVRLSHPNLVRGLYSDFDEDGVPYVVMERADETLDEHRARPGVEHQHFIELIGDLARGVDYLHAQGLVHRDIKPRNIFVWRGSDGRPTAKIGDLGLATNQRLNLTSLGTAPYTAVEILEERSIAPETRPRADVYSLAVVTAELLLGVLPPLHFRQGGPWWAVVPEPLSRVLRRGMHDRPEQRHSNCMAFYEELQSVLALQDWA